MLSKSIRLSGRLFSIGSHTWRRLQDPHGAAPAVVFNRHMRSPSPRYLCASKGLPNDKKEDAYHKDLNKVSSAPDSTQPDAKPHTESTAAHVASNIGSTVTHNIASTIHFTQQKYEELEKTLMERMHEKNQRRFRLTLLATVLFIGGISIFFGTEMRNYFTEQTAGLAKETLENKELKIQTQELATAVVQAILENKEIASHAASFLKEAANVPETQQALLKLTLHVLQHKDTQVEVTKISQQLIKDLANDKDTIHELSRLFERVLADKDLKAALVTLVGQLCQDKEVFAAVTDLLLKLGAEPKVTEGTTKLLTESIGDIIQDEEISQQSRQFIADVVGDDLLQKEGGHALWQSIKYAIQPGIIRVTGVTLVVVSVAFAKLMLSPY